MRKDGLLNLLEQTKIRAEQTESPVPAEITRLEIINTLLDYINDPHVRAKVDSIPC